MYKEELFLVAFGMLTGALVLICDMLYWY